MSPSNNDPDGRNDFLVGVRGETISLLRFRQELSKEQALRLAAWIVALVDPDRRQFNDLLDAILKGD